MTRRGTMALVMALAIMGAARVADANQPPGPQLLLAEVSLLPLMILLSLAGGAYGVLRVLQPRAKRWRFLRGASAVLVILISGASEGIGFVVAWIFGILGLQRGLQMVRWGLGAREAKDRPAHLASADPRRLLPAGSALLVLTVALLGMVVAFAGYWPADEGPRQQAFRQFVAYQLAVARGEQGGTGHPRGRPMETGRPLQGTCPVRLPAGARVDYSSDGSRFTVLLPPKTRFPFFPYNYLTSQPSYRADETGNIRMMWVHDQQTPCPPDAPVVAQVSGAEIERMQRLLAGTGECP